VLGDDAGADDPRPAGHREYRVRVRVVDRRLHRDIARDVAVARGFPGVRRDIHAGPVGASLPANGGHPGMGDTLQIRVVRGIGECHLCRVRGLVRLDIDRCGPENSRGSGMVGGG